VNISSVETCLLTGVSYARMVGEVKMDEWQLKATTTTRWQVTGKKKSRKKKIKNRNM